MENTFYKGKKVLVIGHTGFKGSWLCKMLKLQGADVVGYALEPNTNPSMYDLCHLDKQVYSFIGDIRDEEYLQSVFTQIQPEIVFHLAAQAVLQKGYEDPKYTYEVNVMGTVNVLECVRKCKSVKSFVNVTSDKVYEEKGRHAYLETDSLNGFDPYANSKSCSDMITETYFQSFLKNQGISASTVRSGNVIGGGQFEKTSIIGHCVDCITNHEEIIVSGADTIRPYQSVLDVLRGYMLVAEKQYGHIEFAGAYNFGPSQSATTEEVVSLFCKRWMLKTGNHVSWKKEGRVPFRESQEIHLNSNKIERFVGWRPQFSLSDAIDMAVEWYATYLNREDVDHITEKQIQEIL